MSIRSLRCKEIWVVGADRWRNPDMDLPADFAERRTEHYENLRKPLDPTVFVDELRAELRTELAELNDALPTLDWLSIAERRSGAIKLSDEDGRGLSPLFWAHVKPYGKFRLDMDRHLDLDLPSWRDDRPPWSISVGFGLYFAAGDTNLSARPIRSTTPGAGTSPSGSA